MNTTENKAMELKFIANLPQVLLEYLWELANAAAHTPNGRAMLHLQSAMIGGNTVQEVRFEAEDGSTDIRQIFGFQPVDADIEVRYTPKGCMLHLVQWSDDPGGDMCG